MAARRNIVPTAEISIAATVVDPSSLLFPLFSPPGRFFSSLSLFVFPTGNATEYTRRKAKITQHRVKTLIGPNELRGFGSTDVNFKDVINIL